MDGRNLGKIDELLESTSAEKRIKFDFSEIETTESKIVIDNEPEEIPAPVIDVTPVEEPEEPVIEEIVIDEPEIEEPVIEEPVFEEEPIAEEAELELIEESAPVEEEAVEEESVEAAEVAAAAVLIDQFIDDSEPVIETKQKKEKVKKEKQKKEKQPKDKKSKVKFLQIALIVIVSIATAWTVMYTVDHTLAAQGISPMFAISETVYDDYSRSYKCLGYKVQFMFDSNDRLTQKCVPAWEDGPNDIRVQQGLLFEVN